MSADSLLIMAAFKAGQALFSPAALCFLHTYCQNNASPEFSLPTWWWLLKVCRVNSSILSWINWLSVWAVRDVCRVWLQHTFSVFVQVSDPFYKHYSCFVQAGLGTCVCCTRTVWVLKGMAPLDGLVSILPFANLPIPWSNQGDNNQFE